MKDVESLDSCGIHLLPVCGLMQVDIEEEGQQQKTIENLKIVSALADICNQLYDCLLTMLRKKETSNIFL